MRTRVSLLSILAVVVCGVTVYAHHSGVALYDSSKTVKLEGRLISFSYRSPHSSVVVEAADAQGKMQRWEVAWNAASALAAQNITRETFKAGDHIIITGNPGRRPEDHIMKIITFLRPSDGLTWGGRPGETFQ